MTSTVPAPPELDAAILAGHWTFRFVENGVPLDDVEGIVAALGTWATWCSTWQHWAGAAEQRAAAAEECGAERTAAELRLVASLEHHFAKFLFVHEPDTLRAAEDRATANYRWASERLAWPGRPVGVPFEGGELPAVLRLPYGTERPAPVVVVVPGLDASKEEMHRFSEVFLARGMATLAIDGPGQGELDLCSLLRPDWEQVAGAVADHLAGVAEVDGGRIGVVGVSLGGYFASRAAAADRRIRAAACVGGCFDLGAAWSSLAVLSRLAFQARSGAADAEEAQAIARRFTLADMPATSGVPLLVVHGGRDRLFLPAQAHALAEHFGPGAQLVVDERGNHVLHNLAYRVRPMVADWMAQHLAR